MYDFLIVGAGFAGAVLAERVANVLGGRVLVIDRRPHIAGNAYDQVDEAGLLVHRYGPAMPWERMLTSEYGDLVDDACRFEHDGLKTLASFKRGKAVLLIYQKLHKSPMSKKEVFSVLARAVHKPDWVLVSGDSPNPCWRTGDSAVFAYYFPEARV